MRYLIRWIDEGVVQEVCAFTMQAAVTTAIALANELPKHAIHIWQGEKCIGRYMVAKL